LWSFPFFVKTIKPRSFRVMKNRSPQKPHEKLHAEGQRLKRLKLRKEYKRDHMNPDGSHKGTYKP
jgi:hypothetical protein